MEAASTNTAPTPSTRTTHASPLRWLAAIVAAGVLSGPAHAEFASSDNVFEWLTEAARKGGSFKDSTLSLGYVVGVHDLLPDGEVCLPPKATAKQMQLDILQWMKDNRLQWDPVGARTVRRALMETYACPGEPAQ
jgi:hypothetical protein